MKRSRMLFFFLTIIVIVLGFASRKFDAYLPPFLGKYAGDTVWALMVYFAFAFLLCKKRILFLMLLSLAFSFSIEFSQLYQVPWINSLRGTLMGGLILGHGFLASDLVCYTVGIMIGAAIDALITKRKYRSGLHNHK